MNRLTKTYNSVRIVNMDKVKIADLSKDNLQGE